MQSHWYEIALTTDADHLTINCSLLSDGSKLFALFFTPGKANYFGAGWLLNKSNCMWWAHLADFVKPDYPLDIPPERLPFVRHVFTEVGAPRACPEAACRRAGACRGGDGPPCFRAGRRDLSQVLFLWWLVLFFDLPEEDYEAALRARGNRYAPAEEVRRRRRR